MNTKENPDINFYGKVYGTGNAMLIGNPQELQVNAAVTTNRNTNFVYITNATASAASNQFIKFVDTIGYSKRWKRKNPKRIFD